MRNVKTALLLILTLITVALSAQPSKNPLDTIKVLPGGQLWQYPHAQQPRLVAVILAKDQDRNLLLGNNPRLSGNSVNNLVQADNVYITDGSNNSVLAQNTIIEQASGITSTGADMIFRRGSNYSFGAGDAHQFGGYASAGFGFGNFVFTTYGVAIGSDIVLGGLNKSTIVANQFYGGAAIGRNIRTAGNDITAIGYNLTLTTPGFTVGYGSNQFQVLTDGRILLNGLEWPATLPQPGDQLIFAGNGKLVWQAPAATTARARIDQEGPQTWAFYNTAGQLVNTQILYGRRIK